MVAIRSSNGRTTISLHLSEARQEGCLLRSSSEGWTLTEHIRKQGTVRTGISSSRIQEWRVMLGTMMATSWISMEQTTRTSRTAMDSNINRVDMVDTLARTSPEGNRLDLRLSNITSRHSAEIITVLANRDTVEA